MIPDGQGNRVHFSIPDHEWEWFEMVCIADEEDPYRWLAHWVAIGARVPETLRECVREAIKQYIQNSMVDGFRLEATPPCVVSPKRN